MAALPHQPPSSHLTFGSELRSHPSSMPATLPGKGDNQQRGCAGRLLKELGGRRLVGQQGARTPQRNALKHLIPRLPSLLSPSVSPLQLTESHCQTQCPVTPADACGDLGNSSAALRRGCLGLCSAEGCPCSSGPVLSMHLSRRSLHRAASAPLPHEPPALPLLLPAWVPPPLPPLQQISLKCAAIWFQLSPIFFLVD